MGTRARMLVHIRMAKPQVAVNSRACNDLFHFCLALTKRNIIYMIIYMHRYFWRSDTSQLNSRIAAPTKLIDYDKDQNVQTNCLLLVILSL